jgi:hypothetical protein
MLRLAADPGQVQALGRAARRRALTQFTEAAAIDGVAAVYRSLLGDGQNA